MDEIECFIVQNVTSGHCENVQVFTDKEVAEKFKKKCEKDNPHLVFYIERNSLIHEVKE